MFRFNFWPRPFLHPAAQQSLEGAPFFPNPLALPPGFALPNGVDAAKASTLNEKDKGDASYIPYSTSFQTFFRPGDTISPATAALYSPLHHQFLRAHLEWAAAAQQRSEHPPSSMAHVSAFAPTSASKRSRMDDSLSHMDNHISRRSIGDERVGSPPPHRASVSRSASRHSVGESRSRSGSDVLSPREPVGAGRAIGERMSSPLSQLSRASTPRDLDESDGRRSNAPSEAVSSPGSLSDGLHCPICRCGLVANREELSSHLAHEMGELRALASVAHDNHSAHMSLGTRRDTTTPSTRARYETFMRIRGNRENRLAKLRGFRRKRIHDDDFYHVNGHDESFSNKKDEDEPIDIMSCDDSDRTDGEFQNISSTRKSLKIQAEESICCGGCSTSFTKVVPIISTKCWHVRCDTCWQESNDQCPQCKATISQDERKRLYI